jgi:hypothetical protein
MKPTRQTDPFAAFSALTRITILCDFHQCLRPVRDRATCCPR